MISKVSSIALGAVTAAVFSAPALAADFSLTSQGVTFEISLVDDDTLNLTMLGTNAATDSWAGVDRLTAFMIKDVGSGFTGATATGPGAFAYSSKQLNANGCDGGSNSAFLCFTGNAAVAPSLSWDIDVTGAKLNVSSFGPHLMVNFRKGDDRNATGSLLSANIPVVPEPESYALALSALGILALFGRRRAKKT